MLDLADRLNRMLADRYAIQRELGAGGMAKVFLAKDLKHRRSVAIKVLHPELAAVIGAARFLREIEIAAGLHHPHILPLYDSGSADELLYYVMPYVEGESLRVRLQREGQLPVRDALRLAEQVASALDYAHRRGVVHRDIKPENILLADGQAVVADFGIARAIVAAGTSKLTATGATLGTPLYMSPEQSRGSDTLDGRSDLYGLGCVLYELLAGQPPFTGVTAQIVAHQHLNVSARPVRALRPSVPVAVERALETALAKAPADRFGTCSEFAAAIATAEPAASPSSERDAPVSAGAHEGSTETAATVPMEGARRGRRPLVVASGAMALMGLLLATWWFGPWRGAGPPPDPAKRAWVLVAEFDGSDSSTAAAARDLVMAALEQSEVVSAVPSDQIRLALQMAGKPSNSRVDADLARELAYRSSVRTVLEGRVGRLGSGYSVVLKLVDVDSARVVLTLSDVARDQEALIHTVSRIASRLRVGLGERRAAVQATRELAVTMTPSLEAFKLRQRSWDLQKRGDFRGSIEMARSALALDPDFAGAWITMAYSLANVDEPDSAIQAFREAFSRAERLSPAGRLFARSAMANMSGDHAGNLATLQQLVQLHPDNATAHMNLGVALVGQKRLNEALESQRIAEKVSPFGPSEMILWNQFFVLLVLGRVDEARQVASRLTGGFSQGAPMQIAEAAGDWSEAEKLATIQRVNPAAPEGIRNKAHWILAAAQASTGRVEAAAKTLRQMQTADESASQTIANDARWGRLMLAVYSRRVATRLEDPGPWAPTTYGLVTRGAWAAMAGDTALARRLLATVRTRSAAEIARQGMAPALIQDWIAARAGRWQDVLQDLGPAALQGSVRGHAVDMPSLLRWLVAEAHEKQGRPDSAASYLELAIAPPPSGGLDFSEIRMASSFGHQRLVLLYARMGRLVEARRHWEAFSQTFTRPDPEMAPLIEEARAALAGAEGTTKSGGR